MGDGVAVGMVVGVPVGAAVGVTVGVAVGVVVGGGTGDMVGVPVGDGAIVKVAVRAELQAVTKNTAIRPNEVSRRIIVPIINPRLPPSKMARLLLNIY